MASSAQQTGAVSARASATSHSPASELARTEKRAGSLRVRRPPKRLLSPPTTLSSSSTNLARTSTGSRTNPSSIAKAALAMTTTAFDPLANAASFSSSVTTKTMSSPDKKDRSAKASATKAASSSFKGKVAAAVDVAQPVSVHQQQQNDLENTGPGKRKRKPSTMTRPPATITSANSHSTNTSTSKAKSAAAHVETSSFPSSATSSKTKIKIRHSTGSTAASQAATCEIPSSGYESDGGNAAALQGEPDWEVEREHYLLGDYEGIEAPPLIFQRCGTIAFRRPTGSARSGNGGNCGFAKARGSADWPSPSAQSRKRTSYASQRKTIHCRTKSLPSLAATSPHLSSSALKRSLADPNERNSNTVVLGQQTEEDDDEEEEEEEEDFHRAMLDGEFDGFDDWPSSHESTAITDVDTPATTPGSPQSACEVPTSETTDDASKGDRTGNTWLKNDDLSEVCDAVFSHALAPSSRRVKSHAGLLTLSLPYDEATAATQSYCSSAELRRDGFTLSHFHTTALERGLSKSRVVSSARLPEDGDEACIARSTPGTQRGSDESTSPPMSPMHAFLTLTAVSKSTDLPGTASMVSSPFLAAVRQSSLTRSGSPDTVTALSLPAAVMTASEGSSHGTGDVRVAMTPQPGATAFSVTDSDAQMLDDSDDALGIRDFSREQSSVDSSDGFEADGSSPLTVYSPSADVSAECEADDPVFGLPETMGLDDIDMAYGGSGKVSSLPAPVSSIEDEKVRARTDEDSDVTPGDATAKQGTGGLDVTESTDTTRSVKRSLNVKDTDDSQAADYIKSSPRQRRCVTRTRIDTQVVTPDKKASWSAAASVSKRTDSTEGKRTTRASVIASSLAPSRSSRRQAISSK